MNTLNTNPDPKNGNSQAKQHEPYEDETLVKCDVCGVTVNINDGEFCYNAEIDMVYFTCDVCIREGEG